MYYDGDGLTNANALQMIDDFNDDYEEEAQIYVDPISP